jgi:predicted nucleotidyltransferase
MADAHYFQPLRDRDAADARKVAEARARALQSLPALARALRDGFGATRVWLIGSLALGTFGVGSDVDLMTEGLQRDRLADAEDTLRDIVGMHMDLLRIEDLTPQWRGYHLKWGRLM